MAVTGKGRLYWAGWATTPQIVVNGISVLVRPKPCENIEPWRDWWNFDVPVTASAVKMEHYRRLREG
jgi:hypothetical protein